MPRIRKQEREYLVSPATLQSTKRQQGDLAVTFTRDQAMYTINLLIPEEGRWFWKLQDANRTQIYSRYRYYVTGHNIDYWDGFLDDQTQIRAGIYTMVLQIGRQSFTTEVKIGDFDHE